MGQGTSQHLTTVKNALSPSVTCWDVPCPMSYALVKRPTNVMIPQVCECPESEGAARRMRRGRRFTVANLIEIRFGDLPSRDLRSRCPPDSGGRDVVMPQMETTTGARSLVPLLDAIVCPPLHHSNRKEPSMKTIVPLSLSILAGAILVLSEPPQGSLTLMLPNNVAMEFVRIAAGEFMMGCSSADNQCADDEKPAHRVR